MKTNEQIQEENTGYQLELGSIQLKRIELDTMERIVIEKINENISQLIKIEGNHENQKG